MTTITKILAEAFNRVKAEHGVTLRRVDFTGAGIEFSASGTLAAAPVIYDGSLPPETISWPQAPKPLYPPLDQITTSDATHYGSVGGYDDCWWKFERGDLYVWDTLLYWSLFDDGESAQRTVDSQLRAVVNPT